MRSMKRIRINGTIGGILTILLGLWFVVRPYSSGTIAARAVGIAILISGILDAIRFAKTEVNSYYSRGSMIVGLVKILFGIYIATHTDRLLAFFSYIFSVIILFSAVSSLQRSRWLKQAQAPGWKANMTFSCALLIAGIVMLVVPFGAISTAVMIVGGILIAAGVLELTTARRLRKLGEEFFRRKYGYRRRDIIDD